MSDLDMTTQDLPDGVRQIQALQQGGFSDDEVNQYKANITDKLKQGGFSDDEVKSYFTPPKPPDTSALKNYVNANLQVYNAANSAKPIDNPNGQVKSQTQAKSFYEAFKAGLQISTAGLAIRGQMPDTVLPEHADRGYRIANQIGELVGDIPAMVAGGIGGAVAGGAAGGAAGTSVGGLPGTAAGVALGAPVGAGAGAFALPAALRKIMMDHYERGDIQTAGEFMDRVSSTAWEAIKGGVTGAATSVAGPLAGEIAGPVIGKVAGPLGAKVAGHAATFGSELATMTTVGAAMEGHLPHADDFIDGALTLGVMHGAFKTIDQAKPLAAKLRNIYAATGEHPADVIERAQSDVQLKQDLLSSNPKLPEQAQPTELLKKEPVLDEEGKPQPIEGEQFELKPHEDQDKPLSPESHSEDESKILSMIGEKPESEKGTFKQSFDDFYAKNIDFLDPIHSAIKEAEANGAEISSKDNPYEKGRLFAAHMDKIRSFYEYGTRSATTDKINGEGLNQILRDIPGQDLDGFRAYAMSKRGLELQARGIEPGKNFDSEAAQRVIESGEKKYQGVLERTVDFQNRVLEYGMDKGLITPESFNRMVKASDSYLPFHRVQDPDLFTGKGKSAALFKKIFGSEQDIVDPILQIYKNTEAIIKRAEINDVRQSFVKSMRDGNLLDEGQEGVNPADAYLRKVPAKLVPQTIDGEEISRALKKQGVNVEAEDLAVFRPEKTYLKDNQIAVFDDGKRVVYEGSPGVIDALKRLDGDSTAMDIWAKTMKGFANATRVGVVLNPAFGFRHFFRSQIMSGVYSQTGLIPFFHAALALNDFRNESQMYQDWLYHGGASSSWLRLDDTYLENNKVENADKEAPFIGKAWNAIHKASDASEAFIKLTDNLARFAEYKRSVEQGSSPQEAAFRSREVTPDYQKVGLQRSILRTGVAFIGAHINSLDRMAQAFQEDPKGTIAKLSVLTAMSAMVWAANKDDEAVQSLPDWQKDTYWNLNISRMFGGNEDHSALIIRLPKPWAPGIMFGSGLEVALDAFSGEHPNRAKHFAEDIMHSVVPDPMPNMIQPILDQYSNKNAFSGRPLVSPDKEKLLPELQYEPYTSETAKQIAKIIGYVPLVKDIGPSKDTLSSPAVVENYIRAWGGTLGTWALNISDKGLHAAGIGSRAPKPQESLADNVFFREFVSRYPNLKEQDIQDFYENKDKIDSILNSVRYAGKNGDYAAAQAIANSHPDLEVNLSDINTGISTAKKLIHNVQDNPEMSPVEKRQLIDTALFQIGSMAKQGNKMIYDFQKQLKEQGNK